MEMKLPMLPPRRNLPATRDGAGARSREFADTLAALRRRTGKVESRTIRFRCAVTGERFAGIFERADPKSLLRVARIDRLGPDAGRPGTGLAGLFAGTARRGDVTVPVDEIDWSHLTCPCCGDDSGYTRCGRCRELVCDGRSHMGADGRTVFTCCASCGECGVVTGPLDAVSASEHRGPNKAAPGPKAGGKPPSGSPALQPQRPRLPALPWRKRRG